MRENDANSQSFFKLLQNYVIFFQITGCTGTYFASKILAEISIICWGTSLHFSTSESNIYIKFKA